MKNTLAVLALSLLTVLSPATATAGLIKVSLDPVPETIHAGENIFVDIRIAGLQSGGTDNLLGAWSLDLHYNSNFLMPLLTPPAGFADTLGDVHADEAVGGIDTSTAGTVQLFLVSLLSNAELDLRQRDAGGQLLDSFKLATVGFYAPIGSSFSGPSVTFFTDNIVLGDANGDAVSDASGVVIPVQHLPVTVPVPEPGTLALVALALLGMCSQGRQRVASSRGNRFQMPGSHAVATLGR